MSKSPKRIAIVHDFLMQYGGAERVVEALHEIFPEAPIYALVINPKALPAAWKNYALRPHPLLRVLSRFGSLHKILFFIYPWFVERWDFSKYDIVISNNCSFVHGVNVHPRAKHLCYCHVTMRFVWMQKPQTLDLAPFGLKWMMRWMISRLQTWDLKAASKPKTYFANSEFGQSLIQRNYNKPSLLLYPPVNLKPSQTVGNNFQNVEPFFLVVTRLVLPHKRVDIAIQAANFLGVKLKIVGEGVDRKVFEKLAGKTVEFEGRVDDHTLSSLYQNCLALIVCWEEEFGVAPVEANHFGKPIIAYRGGGLVNSQIEGKTATFFDELNADSLIKKIIDFKDLKFDPFFIKAHSMQFSFENFKEKILKAVAP